MDRFKALESPLRTSLPFFRAHHRPKSTFLLSPPRPPTSARHQVSHRRRMPPGFPSSLFLRTAFHPSAVSSFFPPSTSSARHAFNFSLSSFLPSKRFLSTTDTAAPSPIFTESEQKREKERAKLDPVVLARREAILQEVKRQEESRGNQGEVRLSFTVLGPKGVVKHPHLAFTKAEVRRNFHLKNLDLVFFSRETGRMVEGSRRSKTSSSSPPFPFPFPLSLSLSS